MKFCTHERVRTLRPCRVPGDHKPCRLPLRWHSIRTLPAFDAFPHKLVECAGRAERAEISAADDGLQRPRGVVGTCVSRLRII